MKNGIPFIIGVLKKAKSLLAKLKMMKNPQVGAQLKDFVQVDAKVEDVDRQDVVLKMSKICPRYVQVMSKLQLKTWLLVCFVQYRGVVLDCT